MAVRSGDLVLLTWRGTPRYRACQSGLGGAPISLQRFGQLCNILAPVVAPEHRHAQTPSALIEKELGPWSMGTCSYHAGIFADSRMEISWASKYRERSQAGLTGFRYSIWTANGCRFLIWSSGVGSFTPICRAQNGFGAIPASAPSAALKKSRVPPACLSLGAYRCRTS